MVNNLIYLLFFSIFFLEYLNKELNVISRSVTLFPEILSVVTYFFIFARLSREKTIYIHKKYLYLLFFYSVIVTVGIIFNDVDIVSVLVGVRFYFKTIPFFLLPAIYDFSEKQFKDQILFILPLLLIQLPFTVFQRFIQYSDIASGDPISGTVIISSILSILLISSIAVLIGFFNKKQISLKKFIIILFCLFIPTTINETKGTLVLLPIAILLPILTLPVRGFQKFKKFIPMSVIGFIFIFSFIIVYDKVINPRPTGSILDFIDLSSGRTSGYLFHEAAGKDSVGRGDSFLLAYQGVSNSFFTFLFGEGIGSVQDSYLKKIIKSEEDRKENPATMISISNLIWELGFAGLMVYILIFGFIFKDTYYLRKDNSIFGYFAFGWTAVVVIIGLSLFYKNILQFNIIHYLFWFFSGLAVSKSFRMRKIHLNT
ncbi:hypothetical protein C4544_05875 [candidate division WS5 bacterium]|uniref:O-antigen ligase domain-containing protein n=1 Tax=candidate division WS5 bacterium TaxID=2093353 RepID=A0A419DAL8_9BACT|nr:MAG: hypothetical protein C4544_05875 [candidate division WS5 bacterium]